MVQLKNRIGNVLHKLNETVNLVHMIDMLEQQQVMADYMEFVNTENQEEEERKRLCREAAALCLKEIHDHCITYLKEHPNDGSYEEWIRLCHPDNVEETNNQIDHRFYVEDADHRIIWNSYCDMLGHTEWKIKHLYEHE
mmetsp:Transcript_15985/g.20288  ORF Transcript_15985/g.20288 Transcript_15985/m.20288 type:complete len:139 (+) Transcript_15985:125-541(+)